MSRKIDAYPGDAFMPVKNEPRQIAQGSTEWVLSMVGGDAFTHNAEECERMLGELMIQAAEIALPLVLLNPNIPYENGMDYNMRDRVNNRLMGLQRILETIGETLDVISAARKYHQPR